MSDDYTVGDRIAEARRAKGWTQNDLARATFTTQTCITYWESDKRAITVHDLLLVASALGIPATDLIPGDHPTPVRPPVLDLTCLTEDLRDILYRLDNTMTAPDAVIGWVIAPTQTCDTRAGRHWHLFLHQKNGTSLRVGGLHFNTEPEAIAWGTANLRLRHLTLPNR